jgi:hypothetical protein
VFVGDIMVVYRTYLDKANKTRSIMRADMTDKEAMMIVTLSIPTQLVQKHAEKILPGNGISITNFNIFPKQYMTVVIVIELFRSTKQVLWKKISLFVQNIVSSQTRLSASLRRVVIFTQSEPLAQLSHWKENLAHNTFSI